MAIEPSDRADTPIRRLGADFEELADGLELPLPHASGEQREGRQDGQRKGKGKG